MGLTVASRIITPITHTITLLIQIINYLRKPNDPPSRVMGLEWVEGFGFLAADSPGPPRSLS